MFITILFRFLCAEETAQLAETAKRMQHAASIRHGTVVIQRRRVVIRSHNENVLPVSLAIASQRQS